MAITERDGLQDQWYKEAKVMTVEKLPAFIAKLTTAYSHDYGTICHAISAAAIAAAYAVEKSPHGGITGFQAGMVPWQFIREWGYPSYHQKVGAKFLDYGNLLYPQYKNDFTSISADTMKRLQDEAQKMLAESKPGMMAGAVHNHLTKIAQGLPPFGLRVTEED